MVTATSPIYSYKRIRWSNVNLNWAQQCRGWANIDSSREICFCMEQPVSLSRGLTIGVLLAINWRFIKLFSVISQIQHIWFLDKLCYLFAVRWNLIMSRLPCYFNAGWYPTALAQNWANQPALSVYTATSLYTPTTCSLLYRWHGLAS